MRRLTILTMLLFSFSFIGPSVFAVTCGPTVCTCSGDTDCDALFTSNKCKEGTEVVGEDDSGECKKAARLWTPAIKLKQKSNRNQGIKRQRGRSSQGRQRMREQVRSRGIPQIEIPAPEPPALPSP